MLRYPSVIVASVVGIGSVVSATPVFKVVQERIIDIPLPGLVKVAVITTLICGISASAAGGVGIALQLFGETFISWGFTADIVHRVAAIASGGLNSLPWNGSVVMLFSTSGVPYKKGYVHVAVVTLVLPLMSLIAIFVYNSFMG